jgi:mRNA-degrading endonuclease toxin of MazEF toxin-antitoxin module
VEQCRLTIELSGQTSFCDLDSKVRHCCVIVIRRLVGNERQGMTRLIARGIVVAVAAASMAASGCSFSSNQEKTVSKADVAEQISTKVNEKAGHKPQSVTCPDDLKAAVGTSLNCEMTDENQKYGVNVTVTSVDGDRVNFDIVETVNKDDVAKSVRDQLASSSAGHPISPVRVISSATSGRPRAASSPIRATLTESLSPSAASVRSSR